jgi:hypothetical protein
MNAREIVKSWLRERGYDGLCAESEDCGCELEDLAPCELLCDTCFPAYRVKEDSPDYKKYFFRVGRAGVCMRKAAKNENT